MRADDREAALLVRVEPRQVQVRRQAGREAQEAEDDVLDARAHVALADGVHLVRLLARQVQQHRHVVRAEAPERVLVRAQLAQVEAVAVDVVDVAELAGVGDLLQLLEPGWYSSRWPDHQHPARLRGRRDHALGVGRRLRQRLLDEAVLAGRQHALGQLGVGRHRRGDHDRVELGVGQQLVEVGGQRARSGNASAQRARGPPSASQIQRSSVAGQAVEVARQVRAPVAEADDARPAPALRAHRRTRFAASMPRVTPRKSTTSGAPATTASTSRPGWAVTITAQSAPSSASSSGSESSSKSGSRGT